MNKAIEILKEINENASVNLRNLIEIPQAIAELTAHKAKIDELKEWCKEERNFWKSKDYASGFNVAMGQTLLKLEELEG